MDTNKYLHENHSALNEEQRKRVLSKAEYECIVGPIKSVIKTTDFCGFIWGCVFANWLVEFTGTPTVMGVYLNAINSLLYLIVAMHVWFRYMSDSTSDIHLRKETSGLKSLVLWTLVFSTMHASLIQFDRHIVSGSHAPLACLVISLMIGSMFLMTRDEFARYKTSILNKLAGEELSSN